MLSRVLGVIAAASFLCLVLLGAAPVGAAPVAELVAECQAAAKQFKPLADADIQQAKTELVAAVARLDQRIQAAGASGEDWRKFLLWDQLSEQLARKPGPDIAVLERIYAKYASGHSALGLVWFVDVRLALETYVKVARAKTDENLQAKFGGVLTDLARHLETYAAKPTPEDALAISTSLRWLQSARQAPELAEHVRAQFGNPNLLLELSPEILDAAIAIKVEEATVVDDVILGAQIHGDGKMVGQIHSQLFPDANRAVLDVVLAGRAETTNVACKGPVQVHSSASTGLSSVKRVWVVSDGVSSLPAVSLAETESTITGIGVNGGQMLQRIAEKRVAQQKSKAECIASAHAEARLNERMNRQGDELVESNNRRYQEKLRQPLSERKLFPNALRLSTSEIGLQVSALSAEPLQLSTASVPANAPAGADLTVRIHESTINNLVSTALAGMTVHQEEFEKMLATTIGSLPEALKNDSSDEPWTVIFVERREHQAHTVQQPVSVTFGDGVFQVVFRAGQFLQGKKPYPAMNVVANYKIVQGGSPIKAVRQGSLDIYPPHLKSEPGAQMTNIELAAQRVLKRRFAKVFPEETLLPELAPIGELQKLGKLAPSYWACQDGWMTLSWKRVAQKGMATTQSLMMMVTPRIIIQEEEEERLGVTSTQ